MPGQVTLNDSILHNPSKSAAVTVLKLTVIDIYSMADVVASTLFDVTFSITLECRVHPYITISQQRKLKSREAE